MDYEMKMPDLSTAADEVAITEWFIEEGEAVQRGDPIVNVETDKAEMEVESVVSGTLKKIVAPDGETVSSGAVIAIFEVEGGASPAAPGTATASEPPASDPAPTPPPPRKDPPKGGMFARNRERRDG